MFKFNVKVIKILIDELQSFLLFSYISQAT